MIEGRSCRIHDVALAEDFVVLLLKADFIKLRAIPFKIKSVSVLDKGELVDSFGV